MHAESGGGVAVFKLVVDEESGFGGEAGDVDGGLVDAGVGLHLVDVAGADEVVEVLAEVKGVEAVGVELAALVVEGG